MIKAFFLNLKKGNDLLLNARPMKTLFFFCGFLLLFSCAEKVIEEPENLIPKDKMTDILYDLALLNSTVSVNRAAFEKRGVEVMPYLYEKYNIDSIQFVSSDLYYASIPLEYEAMYTAIVERLQKEVDDIEDARKQKNDSIVKNKVKAKDSLSKQPKELKIPAPSKK